MLQDTPSHYSRELTEGYLPVHVSPIILNRGVVLDLRVIREVLVVSEPLSVPTYLALLVVMHLVIILLVKEPLVDVFGLRNKWFLDKLVDRVFFDHTPAEELGVSNLDLVRLLDASLLRLGREFEVDSIFDASGHYFLVLCFEPFVGFFFGLEVDFEHLVEQLLELFLGDWLKFFLRVVELGGDLSALGN